MLRPLGNRIVIQPTPDQQETGLYKGDRSRERNQAGRVLAVGPGVRLEEGMLAPMNCKVGDVVIYNRVGAAEEGRGKERVVIVPEYDVLCILDP